MPTYESLKQALDEAVDKLVELRNQATEQRLRIRELKARVDHYDAARELPKEEDVHTEHCCLICGCKYGYGECAVMSKKQPQKYAHTSYHDW